MKILCYIKFSILFNGDNLFSSNCQSLLPATGAPVSRQRSGKLKEMFDDYVCQRTNENWKFWIVSFMR